MVSQLWQCENYNSKQKWSLPQCQNSDGGVATCIKHAICKCNAMNTDNNHRLEI